MIVVYWFYRRDNVDREHDIIILLEGKNANSQAALLDAAKVGKVHFEAWSQSYGEMYFQNIT